MIFMEKICIDYKMTLEFLEGKFAVVEKIKNYSEEEICVSVFTAYELLSTVSKGEVIQQFLSNVTILPFDRNSSSIAANIEKYLSDKNIKMSPQKIFNAAICISNGAFLVSKDHAMYDSIRNLKIV